MAARSPSDRLVILVGGVGVIAYLVQARLGLTWPALAQLQADETYRVGSGLVVAAFLIFQWSVATRRALDPVRAVARHRLAGALAPLVLYLHASRFGYGYLLVLASIFLGTVVLGLLHGPMLGFRARWLFTVWFVLHVTTSLVLVIVGGFHVAIALAYE